MGTFARNKIYSFKFPLVSTFFIITTFFFMYDHGSFSFYNDRTIGRNAERRDNRSFLASWNKKRDQPSIFGATRAYYTSKLSRGGLGKVSSSISFEENAPWQLHHFGRGRLINCTPTAPANHERSETMKMFRDSKWQP